MKFRRLTAVLFVAATYMICCLVIHPVPSAIADEAGVSVPGDDELPGDDNEPITISNDGPPPVTSQGGAGVSSSGGAGAGAAAQVACLSDSGAVKNAIAAEVCKSVLPKCSKLKAGTVEKVKDMLSQKIWGYYNGLDVDLIRSSPSNLVGTKMPYAVCSVVGHKVQYSAGRNDLELTKQSIGKKESCGLRPSVVARKKGRHFELKYDGQNGSLWISYMLGAYPSLIRAMAAEVLDALKDDMSNLGELVSSTAMNNDLVKLNAQMKDFTKKLSAEARASCDLKEEDLIAKCTSGGVSVNDPAQRLCTMVKAQLAANDGAVPHMLVYEIMQRVQKKYDQTFAKLITFDHPTMKNLVNECGDTASFGRSRKKKLAMTASCFFSGRFCATDSGQVTESNINDAGRCGSKDTRVVISSGKVAGGFPPSIGEPTLQYGFASVVEQLIRKEVCGQNRPSDPTVCDRIDIPSKPKNAP